MWPFNKRIRTPDREVDDQQRSGDSKSGGRAMDFELEMIMLDSEGLAEGGIQAAYKKLLPELRKYVKEPDEITEVLDIEAPSYSVRHRDHEYVIYGPEVDDDGGRSWGNATYAFFSIVNTQLAGSPYRFYAINGGNDLGGIFLTPEECEAAKKTLEHKYDWPYLPTAEYPAYGQQG